MSKRANKQNKVSALIKKKPYDCMYEKGGIKSMNQRMYMVDKQKVLDINYLVDEVLETDTENQSALAQERCLEFLGLRIKESSEAPTSKDSSNYKYKHSM